MGILNPERKNSLPGMKMVISLLTNIAVLL